jgi:hypothetical protein
MSVSPSPVPSCGSDRSPGNGARNPAAAVSPGPDFPGIAVPPGAATPPGSAFPPGAIGVHRPGPRPGRALGLVLLVLAAAALASCRPAPGTDGPKPAAPAGGVAAVDFRNATYAPDSCSNFGDVPGGLVVRAGHAVPGADGPVLSADVWDVARGDVSGDGRDEAVVTLGCAGMSPWAQAWVFADNPAAPSGIERLGEVRIPERVQTDAGLARVRLISATVRDGVVVSTWDGYGVDVPVCCPSSTVTATFRADGRGVAPAAPVIVSSPV